MEATLYPTAGGDPIKIGSLTDPRGDALLEVSRSQSRALQSFTGLRAAAPTIFDRVTRTNRFGFQAQKLHADRGAALLYVAVHPDLVPAHCTIKFNNGERTVWLVACGIEELSLARGARQRTQRPLALFNPTRRRASCNRSLGAGS